MATALVAIARWIGLCTQMFEKVPDLQARRREDGGLNPVFSARAVQISVQTFAGPGQGKNIMGYISPQIALDFNFLPG